MTAYKCEFFDVRELLPPSLGRSVTPDNEHRFWGMFDDRLLRVIDDIRREFGPMFVNTWSLDATIQRAYGLRLESGLRIMGQKHFSVMSQHAYGRAIDAVFQDVHVDEVREFIFANHRKFSAIKGIELDVSHLHIDTRNYSGGLLAFTPSGASVDAARMFG